MTRTALRWSLPFSVAALLAGCASSDSALPNASAPAPSSSTIIPAVVVSGDNDGPVTTAVAAATATTPLGSTSTTTTPAAGRLLSLSDLPSGYENLGAAYTTLTTISQCTGNGAGGTGLSSETVSFASTAAYADDLSETLYSPGSAGDGSSPAELVYLDAVGLEACSSTPRNGASSLNSYDSFVTEISVAASPYIFAVTIPNSTSSATGIAPPATATSVSPGSSWVAVADAGPDAVQLTYIPYIGSSGVADPSKSMTLAEFETLVNKAVARTSAS